MKCLNQFFMNWHIVVALILIYLYLPNIKKKCANLNKYIKITHHLLDYFYCISEAAR